jgi:hypothetical protein
MQLQQLQTGICSLIKMRDTQGSEDTYIKHTSTSSNLALIRKIALWWRKIQIENTCILTANILKLKGIFEMQLLAFFKDEVYSPFREEIYLQFLLYISQKKIDSLTHSVSQFELALIKLKLGEKVETSVFWKYDADDVIHGLLRKTLNEDLLKEKKCLTHISYRYKEALFEKIDV